MDVRKALLLPIAALLLVGCTGDGGEQPSGPTTLAPLTASPSPSATAVALPAEATPDTPQAAGAFARFYLAQLDKAFATGDVALISSLHDPGCDTCAEYERITTEGAAAGQAFTGGTHSVRSAEASINAPGDYLVDVFYDRAASLERNSDGTVLASEAPQVRQFLQMRVLKNGEGFAVRGIRFPEVPS